MQQREAKHLAEFLRQLDRQGAGAADKMAKSRQVSPADGAAKNRIAGRLLSPPKLDEELQQSRNDADGIDAFANDAFPEARGAEAEVKHGRAAHIKRNHDGHHDAIYMVDRQHAHHALIAGDRLPLADALRIHQQIVLRQDHALWRTGGAAGIDQQRLVIERRCGGIASAHRQIGRLGAGVVAEVGGRLVRQRLVEVDVFAARRPTHFDYCPNVARAFVAISAHDDRFRPFEIFGTRKADLRLAIAQDERRFGDRLRTRSEAQRPRQSPSRRSKSRRCQYDCPRWWRRDPRAGGRGPQP